MVGTYKLDGKVVSEAKFKKAVYGKDSRAYKKAVEKEQKKKEDIKRAGSKGSRYVKTTRRDGSVEITDPTGKVVETKTAEQAQAEAKAKADAEKKTIVVGVGKDATGKTKVENVGQYLTQEQKRQVSKLTSEKGRLTTEQIKQTTSVDEKGRTVQQTNVQFSYKEQQKSQPVKQVAPPAYIQTEAQKRFRENPLTQSVTLKSKDGEWTFTRTGKTEEKEVPEYIGSGGSIGVAEKPKGLYAKLEATKERLLSDVEKKGYAQEATFKEGALLTGIGAVQGVVGLGKLGVGLFKSVFVTPKKTVTSIVSAGKSVVADPSLLYKTPVNIVKGLGTEFTRNPSGFVAEVAVSAGVFKLLSVAGKAGLAKYKAPKVTGQGQGQTLRVDLGDDVAQTTSKSSTTIKSGSQTYRVEAVTKGIDKADDAGARLQSAKTDLKIETVGKKGDVKKVDTGFARSEAVVSKADDGTVLARGDTVQATTVGDKSIIRQGDFTSIGSQTDDVSRATTIVKTGKGVKSPLVKSADDLAFADDASKKVTSIESSSSKKVLEFEAPKKTTYDTPIGKVEVTSKEQFKNVLYDDLTDARGGSYLTKAEKASNIKVDPYSQTVKEGGLSVSFKGFGDDLVSASPVKPKVSPDAKALEVVKDGNALILQQTDQGFVLSAKKVVASQVPPVSTSSTQALTAVEDIVSESVKKGGFAIEQTAQTATKAKVATQVAESSTRLKPIQYSTVKGATPVSVSKSETQPKSVVKTKTFSSTKVLSEQKTASEAILDVRTRSKSKQAVAQATAVVTDVAQATQQKQAVTQLSAQRVAPKMTGVVARPVPKQLLVLKTPERTPVKQQARTGFDVFVRKKGVFQKVGKKALSKSEALDLGAFTVAKTARATFTLRPSASPVGTVSSRVKGSFSALRSTFFQKNGLFIQKKEKRISTGGEKAEITRKGLLAIKQKGLFKGLKL